MSTTGDEYYRGFEEGESETWGSRGSSRLKASVITSIDDFSSLVVLCEVFNTEPHLKTAFKASQRPC